MKFVTDPAIAVKIRKMQQRVRWQDPQILGRGIDQTRLVIEDGQSQDEEFSFLVIGDSGSGPHRNYHPQRQIAEQMLAHREDCRFLLHTGDVIYLVGSSEYYPENFIEPYREWLVGGETESAIAYDQMVFNQPFLPVLGNHDYYDLPLVYGFLAQSTKPLHRLMRLAWDIDIGWHGSYQGKTYAQAFLDYRLGSAEELAQHLERHYQSSTETGQCLSYVPGQFTRLPNRYYTFRYGGIDFFALDSNTFNAPSPQITRGDRQPDRAELRQQLQAVEQQQAEIVLQIAQLQPNTSENEELMDDLQAKLEQLEETSLDLEKQLNTGESPTVDTEQLDWLKERLIVSWQNQEVRGRVLFFHHPPYVTEATKWNQGQTLAVRHHLRQVLDGVAEAVGDLAQGRPLVDLVLNGHAHCLEYLRTEETGHGDRSLDWLICGGSGYSLRRQRGEGTDLQEDGQVVARSQLFVGRNGLRSKKRRPYSFARINIKAGNPLEIWVQPFVSERFQGQWLDYALEPFRLGDRRSG